jgi:transcriptional regulator with XRE-family HTH domain
MTFNKSRRDRSTPHIKLVFDAKRATREPFDLLGTESRNNGPPFAHGGRTDLQRPRDIRGSLEVIENVLLEHGPSLTLVHSVMQPQSNARVLTSVHMDKLATQSERLEDAMNDNGTSASDLARACDVSPTAVGKWLKGGKLSADNLAAAARALGVREEWLRTGRIPRERQHAVEEREVDRVLDLLAQIQGPLIALTAAMNQLLAAREAAGKKRSAP